MKITHHLSEFVFPELVSAKSVQDIPFTSDALEDWIAQLPTLDVIVLESTISNYLIRINGLVLKEGDRFELLELLRPVIADLTEMLVQRGRNRAIEVSPESRSRQQRASVLLRNMVLGYQRLLVDAAKTRWLGASKKDRALLVERVLFYAGEQLRLAYMRCAFEWREVWQALNISYHYAMIENLDKQRIKDSIAFKQGRGTLDLVYKRAILLAMASPYSLRDSEIEQIHAALTDIAGTLEIMPVTEYAEYAMHVVKLEQAVPPSIEMALIPHDTHYRIGNGDLHGVLSRWLTTGDAPKESYDKPLSAHVLRHLCENLEPVKRRVDMRIEGNNERIMAVVGMAQIHEFLIEIEEEDAPKKRAKKKQDKVSFAEIDAPSKKTARREVVPTVAQYPFRLEDESELGAQLSCQDVQGASLRIGQFMLLRSIDEETWILATICWLRLKNEDQLLLGVALMGSDVRCVTLDLAEENEAETAEVLMLRNNMQNEMLLLPKAQYQPGDSVSFMQKGKAMTLMLGEQEWGNKHFVQYGIDRSSQENLA